MPHAQTDCQNCGKHFHYATTLGGKTRRTCQKCGGGTDIPPPKVAVAVPAPRTNRPPSPPSVRTPPSAETPPTPTMSLREILADLENS